MCERLSRSTDTVAFTVITCMRVFKGVRAHWQLALLDVFVDVVEVVAQEQQFQRKKSPSVNPRP